MFILLRPISRFGCFLVVWTGVVLSWTLSSSTLPIDGGPSLTIPSDLPIGIGSVLAVGCVYNSWQQSPDLLCVSMCSYRDRESQNKGTPGDDSADRPSVAKWSLFPINNARGQKVELKCSVSTTCYFIMKMFGFKKPSWSVRSALSPSETDKTCPSGHNRSLTFGTTSLGR